MEKYEVFTMFIGFYGYSAGFLPLIFPLYLYRITLSFLRPPRGSGKARGHKPKRPGVV